MIQGRTNDGNHVPRRLAVCGSAIVAWIALGMAAATCIAKVDVDDADLPPVTREFRAAWVATVANIDWPSRRGLSTAEQQREMIELLDRAAALNLNAIILQVRPSCDALYASDLEPWSEYLTGHMGQAPQPYYDPLEFAIAEAHARGIELHAWFNPYRALHAEAQGAVSADHISKTKPKLVKKYGKYLWLDPGEPAAAQHSLDVVLDVVERYDIDGVHLDDYFYPYPITEEVPDENPTGAALADGVDASAKKKEKRKVPFPDDASWQRAQRRALRRGQPLGDRDDWRRHNVDQLVEQLYRGIKRRKPWVKFGISPFGIGRPGHPSQIKGFDQYTEIYADARKWLTKGWVDYFTPQLYWPIGPPAQSYSALLGWWHEQNLLERHLWPGNFTSRVGQTGKPQWETTEVIAQIWVTRAQAGADGNVHFSMKALTNNWSGIADALAAGPYREPALVPATPWLAEDKTPPPSRPNPLLKRRAGDWQVKLSGTDRRRPWLWVVRTRYGDRWALQVVPGGAKLYSIPPRFHADGTAIAAVEVAVSAVDRLGREGAVARVAIDSP